MRGSYERVISRWPGDDDEEIGTDAEDESKEELSGEQSEGSTLDLSETDEDEDEGLGDGNIGRSTPDLLDK